MTRKKEVRNWEKRIISLSNGSVETCREWSPHFLSFKAACRRREKETKTYFVHLYPGQTHQSSPEVPRPSDFRLQDWEIGRMVRRKVVTTSISFQYQALWQFYAGSSSWFFRCCHHQTIWKLSIFPRLDLSCWTYPSLEQNVERGWSGCLEHRLLISKKLSKSINPFPVLS